MKYKDCVTFGDYEEIKLNLEQTYDKLIKVASAISIKDGNDFVSIAIKNITGYSAKQIDQLHSNIEAPIEFLAWKARNLFECYIISEYIIRNNAKAKEFVTQIAVDELQINEGFLELSDANTEDTIKKPILERNNHIRSTLKKYGLNESKMWTVSSLAEQIDCQNEYKAFFKLYSKYVHPSSWVINGKENQFDTIVFRNVFFIQSQYYASSILKIAEAFKS